LNFLIYIMLKGLFTFSLLLILTFSVGSSYAQGDPVCPPCPAPPCLPVNTYGGQENWDTDNFCKDDTSMLWATWSGSTVPGQFIWTLVDSFGNNPIFIGPSDGDTVLVLGWALYCLTIIDTSGCAVTCEGIWPGALPLSPIGTPTITPTYCGQSIGAIHLTVNPGEYPSDYLTYEWEDGSTSSYIENLSAGSYTVTITRTNFLDWSCPHVQTFTVPNVDSITLDVVLVPDSSCISGSGDIDLIVSPDQLSYTYQWSNGSSSQDLFDLEPGLYAVTVTGPSPCVASAVYEVQDYASPISSLTATVSPTYCELLEGAADLTVLGGLGPFDYIWSDGEYIEDPVHLPPGISEVTVTGFGDCEATLEIFVPNVDSIFSVEGMVSPNTSCNMPNGSIDLTPNPEGNYQFEWLEGQFTEDLNDIAGGTYQVTITAGSCEINQVYTVEDHTLNPHAAAVVTPSICGFPNGSIDLSVNGGTNPYTYHWSNGMTTQDISSVLAGNYYVTVTGLNGCMVVDTITVTNGSATFSVSSLISPNSACQFSNGSIQLSIVQPGTYTYHWSTGDTVNQLINLNAGLYTVTITQNANCTVTENYTVVDNLPAIDTTWLSSTSCNVLDTGIFSLTLSDLAGCDSVVISMIGYQLLDSTFVQRYTCDANSAGVTSMLLLTANHCDSIVITTQLLVPPDTTTLSGTTCDPSLEGFHIQHLTNRYGCDSMVISDLSLLPSDSIDLYETTCDSNISGVFIQNLSNRFGCDSIITTVIELLPHHHTTFYSSSCKPDEAGIFNTHFVNQFGCDSLVTLNVALELLDTTDVSHQTCDPNLTGIKFATLSSSGGCDSIVRDITILFPQPTLSLSISSDFHGEAISCFGGMDGSITAQASGTLPLNYLWSNGQTNKSISGLGPGHYSLTITDANGCTISSSVELQEPEPFAIAFTVSPPLCFDHADGTIMINPFGGTGPFLFSLNGSPWQATPMFDHLSSGSFHLAAIDANDCQVQEIIVINAPAELVVSLGDDQIIHLGDTAILQALVNVPYDSLATISWSGVVDPNCVNCLTQTFIPILTSTYSVSVSNLYGCTDTDDMTVFVDRSVEIYIPNVFSPNDDHINDLFMINSSRNQQEIVSIEIFDRWGDLMFRDEHFSANDPNHSWNGKMNNQALNPGVFAYRIIFQDPEGKMQVRFGNVTLVR
jgi:gliding motility-associated-like protein